MTDTTPAAWDGRPENPERDGWHWLRNRYGATVPALWVAEDGAWRLHGQDYPAKTARWNQTYLGPALLPAQVAAAVQAEREACAVSAECVAHALDPNAKTFEAGYANGALDIARLIRARGPSSALAAALRQARAEGMREAAALIECGCRNRHDVVAQRPNSAARWNLCEHPNCMMIEAAAILAAAAAKEQSDGE